MTIALAGRRIDAEGSEAKRFPLENVDFVRLALRDLFLRTNAHTLVCSAACGADLLALDEAGKLGVRRLIVLPSSPEKFLKSSVLDRPGDWQSLYERAIAESDLIVLESDSYADANERILDEAAKLAPATAVLVWDEQSRGEGDLTESFGAEAETRGFPLLSISTLQNPSQRAISG